ncbi:MAG: serine/threonine-protein kinase [Candidatus Krumholzibacteriia bacterium]
MDSARWIRIQELFLAAQEQPADARAAWLDAACGDDRELRKEVWSLLESDQGSDAVDQLADRWLAPLADLPEPPSLLGRQVGPYRVLGELGRGGMARVYLAERTTGDFQQQVAVKVLRRDGGDLARRFVHERRILARLDHPNIARLIDGGALDDGSPYLVMEYVDGEPIDLWVDRRRPPLRDLVVLFLQVCDAVQLAHRNLVVHRDLKPSNVLVTADGRVRLLDFGIAKLLADDAPDLTRPFALVLTPEYASPEQVRGEAVTTATDVYALGLMLYRLLTGRTAQTAVGRTDAELRRHVCEDAPEAPSLAAADPARARRLRGDLDTIVARAVAKDPQRRYGSPGELADDLRRWLDGRPVHARPDGAAYHVRKFIQRHRAGVVAAGLALLALFAGLGGTLWQAGEATRERDAARLAAARSDQVTRFLVGLFEAADPMLAAGDTLTARQLLDRGHARIESELADQPRVRAAMLRAMGDAYLNLGLHDLADTLLHQARAALLTVAPIDSLELSEAEASLGRVDEAAGRLDAAADRLGRVLDYRRRTLGARHPLNAGILNNLGSTLLSLGRPDSAQACFEAALAIRESDPATAPLDLAVTLANLASAQHRQGRVAAADSLFARGEQLMRASVGPDHPRLANLLSNWGVMRYREGDLEGAGTRVSEALDIWRRTLGPEHPQVGRGENNLAAILERAGRDAEAEQHYRQSLRIKRAVLGARHPSVASTLNNLALLVQRRGDLAEAESLLRESASIREETLPADHPQVARGWYNLARLLHETDRRDEAERLYRQALELRVGALGQDHEESRAIAESLAGLLRDEGRIDEAAALEARFGLVLQPAQPAGE